MEEDIGKLCVLIGTGKEIPDELLQRLGLPLELKEVPNPYLKRCVLLHFEDPDKLLECLKAHV